MRDVLVKDGYVITMDEEERVFERGDVAIEGTKIAGVGEDLKDSADSVIDARGKAVLPGLINAHTHLSMVLFRGVADDLDLQAWLNEKIWPMERNLGAPHVRAGALLGCLEMVKSGTTCFADQYFFMGEVAQAVEEAGIRANLAYGIISKDNSEKMDEELKIGEELVKDYDNAAEGRIKAMFGPHSTYTCSPECLRRVRKLADKHKVGIHIHLSENEGEVETVSDLYGKSPPALLDSIKFLAPDVLAAHCTKLSVEDIDLIKKNGVKPVHNPVSNMKLGSGMAPVPELLSEGIPVGLGTDGAASNNSLDMLEEIKFAALLSKVSKGDPTVVPARSALKMATINGAKALGRKKEIGSLEAGKKADLVLIDLRKPHLTPIHDVESQLVYSCNGGDVDSVIVDGKILMKGREVLTLDEETILKKCQKMSEKLTRGVDENAA